MLLLSCASGGLAVDATKLNANDPDAATVTVMRQKTIVGAGLKVEIYVDNELTAYLGSGEFYRFRVPAGVHFITARQAKYDNVIRFFAEPGEKYYFFWGISTGACIEPRTEKDAEDLMAKDDFDDVALND
jgi:hypothetical protein